MNCIFEKELIDNGLVPSKLKQFCDLTGFCDMTQCGKLSYRRARLQIAH